MTLELSMPQVARFSLKSHFLVDKAEQGDLVEVISSICGLNSQTARAPYVSLWARIKGFKKEQLDKSLYGVAGARHAVPLLIKTWLMRGTVHTIPTKDYAIYQKALGGKLAGDWHVTLQKHGLGLSPEARAKLSQKIVDLLAETSLTKKELLPQVKHLLQGFSDREQKIILSRTLRGLSYEGLICHAQHTGTWYHFKENRFTAVDRWLEGVELDKVDEMGAKRALALKYLVGYGPASVQDFAYWSGLKAGDAKEAFEGIKDRLVEVRIRDSKGTCWMLEEDADRIADIDSKHKPPVRFLPSFDPLIMGHKDKSRILEEAYRKLVFLRLADVAPVFLVNGRVAGTWNYKFTDRSLYLTPFAKLGKREEAEVDKEFAKLREFLGTE